MQLPIVLGRAIDESDREGAPESIVVNELLANAQWPGESPLGKRLRIGGPTWRTVVGVAKNAVRADWNDPRGEIAGNQKSLCGRLSVAASIDEVVGSVIARRQLDLPHSDN
jgi:hypothetical protein